MNNKAVNLINHGEYLSAYKLLLEAVNRDPHYGLARLNLNLVLLRWSDKYFVKGDFEKALRHSEKAEFYAPFSQEAQEQTIKCIVALKQNPDSIQDRMQLANAAISRNAPDEFLAELDDAISLLKECSNPPNPKSADEYYQERAKDLADALEKRLLSLSKEKSFYFLATVTVFRNGSTSISFPPKTYSATLLRRSKILTSGLQVDWSLYKTDRSKTFDVSVLHCDKYNSVNVSSKKRVANESDESDASSYISETKNHDAVDLNNKAVTLLHQAKYKEAIDLLRECLILFPDRDIFKSNYSIALNNYALAMQNHPDVSLRLFEEALFHDFENETTHHNLDGMLRMLRLNPSSILVRLDLGSKALARNDVDSAIADFKMAMKLTPKKTFVEEENKTVFPLLKTKTEPRESTLDFGESLFYKSYMSDLQREIKAKWFPSKSNTSSRIIVTFDILKNGKIKNLKQTTNVEGIQSTAAFDAVKNAAPFKPPLDKVSIQFTFAYNVFAGSGEGIQNKASGRDRIIGKPPEKKPRINTANLIKIDEYQALLAEKQKVDDKSEEAIELRIKLVKLLVKENYLELAEHLLEEGCDLSPKNEKLKEELVRVKKMMPKKPHPLPKNVS